MKCNFMWYIDDVTFVYKLVARSRFMPSGMYDNPVFGLGVTSQVSLISIDLPHHYNRDASSMDDMQCLNQNRMCAHTTGKAWNVTGHIGCTYLGKCQCF